MTVVNVDAPNWGPLETALRPEMPVEDWMWMCTVEVDGVRIEQYKHIDTRRYLNLDEDGCAYRVTYTGPDWTPWDGTPIPPQTGHAERISLDEALDHALS